MTNIIVKSESINAREENIILISERVKDMLTHYVSTKIMYII